MTSTRPRRATARSAESRFERLARWSIAHRRRAQEEAGWKPAEPRKRRVTTALRAYAAFATSAARGAVRIVPE